MRRVEYLSEEKPLTTGRVAMVTEVMRFEGGGQRELAKPLVDRLKVGGQRQPNCVHGVQ